MSLFLYQLAPGEQQKASMAELVLTIAVDGSHSFHNPFFKILYVAGGEGMLVIDGRERYELNAGDLMVIPHACHQRYLPKDKRNGSRLHAFVIRINLEADDPSPFTCYLRETFPTVSKGRGALEQWELFLRIRNEGRGDQSRLAENWIHTIVASAAEALGKHRRSPSPWHRFEKLASHWAAMPGMRAESPGPRPPFGASFTRHFGLTPGRFSQTMKAERAKVELAWRSVSISKIASDLGFPSSSVFSRMFRKVTALSPSQYRRSYIADIGIPRFFEDAGRSEKRNFAKRDPSRPASFYRFVSLPAAQSLESGRKLLIAQDGEITVFWGDRRSVHLKPADALLLPECFAWHAQSIQPGLAACLSIDLDALPAFWDAKTNALPIHATDPQIINQKRSREAEIILACAAEIESPHRCFRIASLVNTMLLESFLNRLPHPPYVPRRGVDFVEHAKQYILNNYRSSLSLSMIAWNVGLSVEHLARRFRLETGQTVFAYLKSHRIAMARLHLARSDKTLSVIASECGFATEPLFCRTFKQAEGVTPGAFRRMSIQERNISEG